MLLRWVFAGGALLLAGVPGVADLRAMRRGGQLAPLPGLQGSGRRARRPAGGFYR